MKKLLESIAAKETSTESDTDRTRRSSREASSTSRVYEKICIFCNKSSKYLKGQNTREPLIQCFELRADDSIRKAATRKLDERMLSILSIELVAAEGLYHRTCYRLYTRVESADSSSVSMTKEQSEYVVYEEAESQAHEELFFYIRNELMTNPEVKPMTELTSRLEGALNSFGVTELKQSSKKHLRRKLESEFGASLHFFSDGNGRLVVYPDSLSRNELARQAYQLKKELQNTKAATSVDATVKAAMQLRYDIEKIDVIQSWPPNPQQDKDIIPESVTQFLYTLLTGESDCGNHSERIQRLATSFGSDLVFAVTCGKLKPPKHILLPFAVKSLTGNTNLIRILNRFGHGVSYSQVEEIDTALCLQKQDLSNDNVPLPVNVYPGVFTTLAWDNIDRLEETTSGEGTSHRVNGIVVQPKVLQQSTPANVMPVITKSKQRSIIPKPSLLPAYNVGQRTGPPNIETVDVDTRNQVQEARMKNFVWLLARMSKPENQTISSWTGFNIQIRDNVVVIQDTVSYLPTINAHATAMSTVNEVLNQTLTIMKSLHLNQIVCVFDQALYAKTAEIVWKQDKYKNIIIRMGAFHTACNLLSTIGKRFQDAGLRDLCVESGVIAEESVTAVMEGRKYNRAVRVHKLVYEAMMRLAWKGFLPWLETKHVGEVHNLEQTLKSIEAFQNDVCRLPCTN